MVNKSKGFTLLEVLIAVGVVALLSVFVIPRAIEQLRKAKESEATQNLGAIRSAELFLHELTGKFVGAADEPAIQSALGLAVTGDFYNYQIIDATDMNFLAIAIPTGPISDWLEEKAIDKDGWVEPSSYSTGGSSSGGGGGSSGGGGGSGGGGSSGGDSSGSTCFGGSGGRIGTISTSSSTTYSGEVYVPATYDLSASINPPINLTLTPNDSWLVLNFTPYDDIDYYVIERAEKTSGVVGDWTALIGVADPGWEDNVTNGTEYCYRAYTVATLPTGEQAQSVVSDMVCSEAAANDTYTEAINDGETILNAAVYPDPADGAASGAAEVTFLDDPDGDPTTDDAIPILFGQIQDNSLAYYNPNTGALVIDVDYLDQPSEFIATLLAHETLHIIWDDDYSNYEDGLIAQPLYGNNPDGTIREDYSYYNEFSAFVTTAMAWQSIFPDTEAGDAAKRIFYGALDDTGIILYNNMEAAVTYFLDESGNQLTYPTGEPSGLSPDDSAYGLTVLEILQTVYGYEINDDDGNPVIY